MDKRYQVFVSSTYKDLLGTRQKVTNALMKVNAIPAGMELFPSSDDDAWTIIQRAIDQSDYYLVIIGGRYGSCAPDGIGYTEKEYDYAASQKKPIMAFLHKDTGKLPREHCDVEPPLVEKLKAFRLKAEKKHCRFWLADEDLVPDVLVAYFEMLNTRPGIGWVRGDQAKTIEDVEKLAALQEEVTRLTKQNERLASELSQSASVQAGIATLSDESKLLLSKAAKNISGRLTVTSIAGRVQISAGQSKYTPSNAREVARFEAAADHLVELNLFSVRGREGPTVSFGVTARGYEVADGFPETLKWPEQK